MISMNVIKEELNLYKHLFVFIRHGEKSSKNRFCNFNLLSSNGIIDSIEFGKKVKELNIPIRVFSSPEFRCVQTAKLIVEDFKNTDITLTRILGEPGIQVKNMLKYNKIYENKKCREIYDEWKKGKYYDILLNPDELKMQIENFFYANKDFKGISLCVTQSGTVAHLGYILNKKNFDVIKGEWVDFLDGFCFGL